MDLARELEAHALLGAGGAAERFASAALRQRLRERVARGRRRANVIATVVVALLSVGAATLATPQDPTSIAIPSPNAPVPASLDRLPVMFSANYLVDIRARYDTSVGLRCEQIPSVPVATDGLPFPGFMAGLPRWIEADRIYGVPDVLPAPYPIPLYPGDGSGQYNQSLRSLPQLYPADHRVVVALIAADGSWWGFTAKYQVLDATRFDRAGMFVTLTPDPTCHGGVASADGTPIPPGVYAAREMTAPLSGLGAATVRDVGTVEIVTGLPSIPQLNGTK